MCSFILKHSDNSLGTPVFHHTQIVNQTAFIVGQSDSDHREKNTIYSHNKENFTSPDEKLRHLMKMISEQPKQNSEI